MELMIEIPEEVYNHACDSQLDLMQITLICDRVSKGTLLPHHGDLVDIDKLYDTVFNPRDGILEIYKDRTRAQLENALESAFDDAPVVLGGSNNGK